MDMVELSDAWADTIDTKPAEHYRFYHNALSKLAVDRGEWAGCPFPISGYKLAIEPRSPFVALDGFQLDTGSEEFEPESGEYTVVNSWYSWARNAQITIYRHITGKTAHYVRPLRMSYVKRLDMALGQLGAATDVWTVEAELTACEALGDLVTPHAINCYLLTGSFLETSKKSKVTYLFRKSRPTVAMVAATDGMMRIISVLCLHPIGYYQGTWAGTMVPTDDVIAHLLMMRGDEAMFWRKANHHHVWDNEAGL